MRYSSRCEAIVNALSATKSHPDAEWVYARVREEYPRVSLGTVYRNLRELAATGAIHTVETEDGVLHFDADTSPHAHFVCNRCGRISDLFDVTDAAEQLQAQGYSVQCVKTVAYGVCDRCGK